VIEAELKIGQYDSLRTSGIALFVLAISRTISSLTTSLSANLQALFHRPMAGWLFLLSCLRASNSRHTSEGDNRNKNGFLNHSPLLWCTYGCYDFRRSHSA
jgi:hypothetical protein